MKIIDLSQDADRAIIRTHNPIDKGVEAIIIDKVNEINTVLEVIRSIINKYFCIKNNM